jgi:hypothetical protein
MWNDISENYANCWNFPNCIVCIDSKCNKCPGRSGSKFYNYKLYFIMLQVVVDSDYKLIAINIGIVGCQSDAGKLRIFLYKLFERRELISLT